MAKDYYCKYFTRVRATADAPTLAGSNVFYGRQNITANQQFITATGVKSSSVVLITMQSLVTSVEMVNSYYRLPSWYVTSIQEAAGFCVQTVVESNAAYPVVTSYTCHWIIANPK